MNTIITPDVSLVIPVFNSQEVIVPFYQSLINAIRKSAGRSFEIIFVDDFSSDTSVEKILEIRKTSTDNISLIRLNKNYGQYLATVCGIYLAKGAHVITLDIDPSLPALISKLLDASNPENDLIYAELTNDTKSLPRTIGSKLFNTLVKAFVSKTVKPQLHGRSGSSFRLIKQKLVQKSLAKLSRSSLLDVCLMNAAEHTITFTPLKPADQNNKSNYSAPKLIGLGVSLIFAQIGGLTGMNKPINPREFIDEVFN